MSIELDAWKDFEAKIEAALDEYQRIVHPSDNDVIADWVVGYTRQSIMDERLVFANAMISKLGSNPNATANLGEWVSTIVMDQLLDVENDDPMM